MHRKIRDTRKNYLKMPSHIYKKLFIAICLFLTTLYFLKSPQQLWSRLYYTFKPEEGIQCYRSRGKMDTLPHISNKVQKKAIFFHETSCKSFSNGKITLNSRQACAVESAARQNPKFSIYLLFASPGRIGVENTENDRFLRVLQSYQNIIINHLDYEKYIKNSPVETLYQSGEIEYSAYAKSHASDVLRYLTLWKHAGIYLDLDVIVTKSLETLGDNFSGRESDRNVAAGILGFGSDKFGRDLARQCLEDLRDNFKGNDWGNNGPGVITRLSRKLCGVHLAKDMVKEKCNGFQVYSPEFFYPVGYWNWTMYFDENSVETVEKLTRNSYIIHVWNKYSSQYRIPKNKNVPYVLFAQKYCPKIFQECEEFF